MFTLETIIAKLVTGKLQNSKVSVAEQTCLGVNYPVANPLGGFSHDVAQFIDSLPTG